MNIEVVRCLHQVKRCLRMAKLIWNIFMSTLAAPEPFNKSSWIFRRPNVDEKTCFSHALDFCGISKRLQGASRGSNGFKSILWGALGVHSCPVTPWAAHSCQQNNGGMVYFEQAWRTVQAVRMGPPSGAEDWRMAIHEIVNQSINTAVGQTIDDVILDWLCN